MKEAYALKQSNIGSSEAMNTSIRMLIDQNEQTALQIQQANEASSTQARNTLLLIIIVAAIAAIGVGGLIARTIAVPLRAVQAMAGEIARGNLALQSQATIRQSTDETGQLASEVQLMLGSLRGTVGSIRQASAQVGTASSVLQAGAADCTMASLQITAANQELAAGSEKQLDEADRMLQACTRMQEGVRASTTAYAQVEEAVLRMSAEAAQGQKAVGSANEQMGFISDRMAHSSVLMDKLHHHSQDTQKIAAMIAEVAERTKLLALNATIEAARAGEHGQSFAVIAMEVNKLAAQSAGYAQHVEQYSGQMLAVVDQSIAANKAVAEEIHTGNGKLTIAHTSLNQIANAAGALSATFSEFYSMSDLLRASCTEVASAAENSREATIITAAAAQSALPASENQLRLMESINSCSDELAALSQQLEQVVNQFKGA